MSDPTSVEGYSTIADFELIANGESYDVSQVAGEFIILDRPVEIPPCEADLIIRIEGQKESHRRIRLPQGASLDSDWVTIERIPDSETANVTATAHSSRRD